MCCFSSYASLIIIYLNEKTINPANCRLCAILWRNPLYTNQKNNAANFFQCGETKTKEQKSKIRNVTIESEDLTTFNNSHLLKTEWKAKIVLEFIRNDMVEK